MNEELELKSSAAAPAPLVKSVDGKRTFILY